MSTNAPMSFGDLFPKTDKSSHHQEYHLSLLRWAKNEIFAHREILGIPEAIWQIEVKMCCQKDLPESEGTMAWHRDARQASMSLRCDMTPVLTQWVIIHELIELRRSLEADIFVQALSSIDNEMLREHLLAQYRTSRNQDIEAEVRHFLGYYRPGHLTAFSDESMDDLTQCETLILLPKMPPQRK